ncbi:MAG TPA: DUF4384 domain-containing protein [Gemmatimonadales bacterium]|jgi:hypothetical protein|nr:DUF4384 domain-containing protein [Gemmatimonadales bacterium]
MILPLVALLWQTAPAPAVSHADGKPVRVWLGAGSTLVRGDPVHVYVQAATAGSLVVLHRRTDGRIEVLFPANPSDDPSVTAGTYEIRGAGDRESFVVAEPDGSGLILAALSTASYRFDEFVREASWDPDALVPSWRGADGEGALADVVQRMLGDGYFNYDLVTYTVAPQAYALQDTTAPSPTASPCVDCSFAGFELILDEPFFLGAPRFRRHAPFGESGAPGANPPTRVLGLAAGRSPLGSTPAAVASPPGYVSKPLTASPAVSARTRAPVPGAVRAIPLGPGHQAVGKRPANRALAARSRPAAPAPFQEVHLTLSPTAPPAEPQQPTDGPRSAGLVATPHVAVPARAERTGWVAVPRSRLAAAVAAPSGAPLRGAVMGARTTGPMRPAALGGAASHVTPARGAPVAAAGRRR